MLRISVSHALPARARRLTRDDMDRVFGGCADENVGCGKDSDCCPSW